MSKAKRGKARPEPENLKPVPALKYKMLTHEFSLQVGELLLNLRPLFPKLLDLFLDSLLSVLKKIKYDFSITVVRATYYM